MSFKSLQPDTDNRDQPMTNPKWFSDEGNPGSFIFEEQDAVPNFLGNKVTIEIYGTVLLLLVRMELPEIWSKCFLIRLFLKDKHAWELENNSKRLIDTGGKLGVYKKLKPLPVKWKSYMHYSKEGDKTFLIFLWKVFVFNCVTMCSYQFLRNFKSFW